MKSRFPTPENIGKYPSTFGSSYADFGHESPTEQQTSEIKTFSEIVFTDPKLKQIANAIGYTKTHAESLNDKYGLPNMSESERTSFATYFLLLALSMPQFAYNWHAIAKYTNKALTQGIESVQGAMTSVAWTRLFQMFKDLKEDTLPPGFVQRLDSIAKKREQVEKGVKIPEYLKNRRSKPTEEMMQRIQAERLRREEAKRAERAKRQAELKRQVSSEQDSLMPTQQTTAVPQVQATYDPQLLDDSQIADVADVEDVTEVTSGTEGKITFTVGNQQLVATQDELEALIEARRLLEELELEEDEIKALIEAKATLALISAKEEELKKEFEAAKKSASTSKYVAIGLGIALLAGGGYWYYTTTQQNQ